MNEHNIAVHDQVEAAASEGIAWLTKGGAKAYEMDGNAETTPVKLKELVDTWDEEWHGSTHASFGCNHLQRVPIQPFYALLTIPGVVMCRSCMISVTSVMQRSPVLPELFACTNCGDPGVTLSVINLYSGLVSLVFVSCAACAAYLVETSTPLEGP